jgi:hypothetical protein
MNSGPNNLLPKYYEITPSIQTELIQYGFLKLVRATVHVGPKTVTSFSDMIGDAIDQPMRLFELQALNRAMQLILSS